MTIELNDIVGRRELEEIIGLRPTQIALLLKEPTFPEPIKVLKDGTRLWSAQDIFDFGQMRPDLASKARATA